MVLCTGSSMTCFVFFSCFLTEACENGVRRAMLVVQAMSKAFQGGKSKSAARVMRAGLNCFAQTLSYFITARVGHFSANGTGAAADVTVKSGISVGKVFFSPRWLLVSIILTSM